MLMLEYRYDTQLLIDGENLDEDAISDYFTENLKGDCLLAVGDEDLIKLHFCLKKLPRELIPLPVLALCESRVIVVTPVEEYVLAVRL